MKKWRTPVIILLIIVALILIKIEFLSAPVQQTGVKPQDKSQPVPVSAYVIKPQKLDNKIFSTGTVLANEEVTLMPEMAGKIVSINFKEGSKVTKGELLVKISDADLQAQ